MNFLQGSPSLDLLLYQNDFSKWWINKQLRQIPWLYFYNEARTPETTYLDYQGWEGIISFSASDQELTCSSSGTPSCTFVSLLPPLPASVLVSRDQRITQMSQQKWYMYVDLYNFVSKWLSAFRYMQWKAELRMLPWKGKWDVKKMNLWPNC